MKFIFLTSVFFSSVSGFFSSGRGLAWKREKNTYLKKNKNKDWCCYLLPPPPGHLRGRGLDLVFVGQLNFPLLLQEARLLYLVKILDRCTQANNKDARRETTMVLKGKQQRCTQQGTRGSVMVTQGTNHWTQGTEHTTQMGNNKWSFFTSGFGTESKSSSK